MIPVTCLYLHIPFCLRKCAYCSFVSFPGQEGLFARYVYALCLEAEQVAQAVRDDPGPLATLFFGGGTPSLLSVEQIATVINCCAELFGLAPGAEVSLEVNPGTVDTAKLAGLRRAGVNRLSIGIQSLDNGELRRLGRAHDREQAIRAVEMARAAGFRNLSLDLMSGLPGQDGESWRRTLEQALALAPEHLSCYQLSIEEGTPFARRCDQGQLTLPDDEAIAAMDQWTLQLTAQAGLVRYEISNFARPGYECRHNLNYWHNRSWLALGAGAVSSVGGGRRQRVTDPEEYCRLVEDGKSPVVDEEVLAQEARFRETVVMGLRLIQGVDLIALRRRFGIEAREYYGKTLTRLCDQGLLRLEGDQLRLSACGLLFANQVMAELI